MVIQARAVSYDPLFVRGTSEDGGPSFSVRGGGRQPLGEFDDRQDPETSAVLAFSHDDVWTARPITDASATGTAPPGPGWPSRRRSTRSPTAFYGLWAKDPNDLWAVGDNVALHFDPTKKR